MHLPIPAVSLVAVEGDERLPRASTCFNTLFLPAYSSPAVLEARLVQAIGGQQAFDEGGRAGAGAVTPLLSSARPAADATYTDAACVQV